MARIRSLRIWTRIHTWTSLISMVFLLMLCVTGLPLSFHDEIDDLFEAEVQAPDLPRDTKTLPIDQAIQAAQRVRPQDHVLFVNRRENSPFVVVVGMSPTPIPVPGQFHRLLIDERTTAILGEEMPHRDVMDIILTLHKDMFTGLPGELFLGAMGILLVVSIVSGVVVYAPFMRRIDFGTIRHRSSPRVTWLDLHNLLGMATVLWLLVVAVTGTINTLAIPLFDMWRAQTLPVLLKPYQGRPVAKPPSIDAAIERVRAYLPDARITSVTMPTAARFGSPQHLVVWTKGNSPLTARLLTPVLVNADASLAIEAPQVPWYLRFLQVSRPLHFGDYGGLPLKIIWALLDLLAIIVLVSGIYLWFAKSRFSSRAYLPMTPGPKSHTRPADAKLR